MALMFLNQDNNHLKCCWFSMFVWFVCFANARQIRYDRFNTQVENQTRSYIHETQTDEIEINATVREINIDPYPASGFKPIIGFFLPNEAEEKNIEATQASVDETTTTSSIDGDFLNKNDNKKLEQAKKLLAEAESSPYRPAGFRPKVPFILPTEVLMTNKTESDISYPAKTFILPSGQIKIKDDDSLDTNYEKDNSNHPACGSSTNPLSPKPKNGENSDPDSEPVNTDLKLQRVKK